MRKPTRIFLVKQEAIDEDATIEMSHDTAALELDKIQENHENPEHMENSLFPALQECITSMFGESRVYTLDDKSLKNLRGIPIGLVEDAKPQMLEAMSQDGVLGYYYEYKRIMDWYFDIAACKDATLVNVERRESLKRYLLLGFMNEYIKAYFGEVHIIPVRDKAISADTEVQNLEA